MCIFLCFFKQKTAYEMRLSDWSSDVCSSDLRPITLITLVADLAGTLSFPLAHTMAEAFGWRASCFAFALLICLVGLPLMWRGARSLEAVARAAALPAEVRSEERRVGKGGVSPCKYRGSAVD